MRMLDLIHAQHGAKRHLVSVEAAKNTDSLMYSEPAAEYLSRVVPFEVSDVADYYGEHHSDFHLKATNWDEIIHLIRPPYPVTFFEWSRDHPNFAGLFDRRVESVGLMLEHIAPSTGHSLDRIRHIAAEMWAVVRTYKPELRIDLRDVHSLLLYAAWARYDRTRVDPIYCGALAVTAEGRPVKVLSGSDPNPYPFQVRQNVRDDLIPLFNDPLDSAHPVMNIPLMAVSLLNTVNVRSAELPNPAVPDKVAERRRAKTGRDPFVYRTLDIRPMGNKRREPDADREGSGAAKRLHIARGHYKHYTTEAPLFGRHVGTYWWNSQVRGDMETGSVEKDYRVKLPKESK